MLKFKSDRKGIYVQSLNVTHCDKKVVGYMLPLQDLALHKQTNKSHIQGQETNLQLSVTT